jgi:hypothetical protein
MPGACCARCNAALAEAASYCSFCGEPVAGAVTAGRPSDPASQAPAAVQTQPASSGTATATLVKLARAAKIVALLCFILPWVTISCSGQTLVSMSGLTLATGKVVARNPVTGATEAHAGAPEVLVIVGALLIVFALLMSFAASRRQAAGVGLFASIGAAVLLGYEVLVRLPQQMRHGAAHPSPNSLGSGLDQSMLQLLRIDTTGGFWLMIAALVAAIFFNNAIRKRPESDRGS